jgi:hypothetical protein
VGVPDRLILADKNIIAFAEIKGPRGKYSSIQGREIARIQNKGFIADILWNEMEVVSFVEILWTIQNEITPDCTYTNYLRYNRTSFFDAGKAEDPK